MATLFQRVIGTSGEKIPIHLMQACISEVWRKGRTSQGMTGARAVDIMAMTADQITDIQVIQDAFATASDKSVFLEILFNYWALGELGVVEYEDEDNFWIMINSEATQ